MKIGIFGGCFNPPHKAHKSIAEKLIELGYVDKVIYVPTGNKYNKKDLISDSHRYNMLNEICKKNSSLEVSDYEFKTDLTYTYQTLDYFKENIKDSEIYFICGADNIIDIENWKNSNYLLANYKFIVVSRDNKNISDIISKYSDRIIPANIEVGDISSTQIRSKIEMKDLIYLKNNLDEEVLSYILENKIYN